MKIKYSFLRRAELIVYVAFIVIGVFLTSYGSAIYNEALFSREPEIPKGLCIVCVTQIEEIDSLWFSIQPPNTTDIADDSWASVSLIIFLNTSRIKSLAETGVNTVDVNIVVPGVADNFRCEGVGLSFVNDSLTRLYDESVNSTGFNFKWSFNYDPYGDALPTQSIGPVTFDWRIIMRESYDEYGLMAPIPPSQALWMGYDLYYIHEFRLMVTLGEGESLDLSETFPAPYSYTRGYSHGLPQQSRSYLNETLLPTYTWEFMEDELRIYDWLYQGELPFVRELTHVVFSLDTMRHEKEKTLFTSGIYFGLGTSTIFTGLYSLLQMLALKGREKIQNSEKTT